VYNKALEVKLVIDVEQRKIYMNITRPLSKGYHLDVVGGPSTPHDPESDVGWSLSS
jgi:hypothetical protein